MFTLQDSQVTAPGMPGSNGAAQPGTTVQPGGANGGATPQGQTGAGMSNLFFIVAIGGMFIFMLFMSGRAQRAERKKKQEMLNAMSKHDKVQTIGGIIGTVSEIRDDEIVLKIDESSNTKMTFAKSAVQQVIRSAGSFNKSDSEISTEPELASAIDS